MLKPEANFDVLYLLSNTNKLYPQIHVWEIQGLCYLSQLISIYDNKDPNEWGYGFINHKISGPFSPDLNDVIYNNKYINHEANEDIISISDKGNELLHLVLGMNTLKWRVKYLDACISASLTMPLPIIMNALTKEPMISQSRLENSR